jgi:uncharacterized protein (TIGR02099 family)
MKLLLKRLIKLVAYLAGGLVILLAIAVGLFRLFLPRLPEYQEDIKGWASAAIGMTVEFSGMDARWGLSGPEVEFYNAQLLSLDSTSRLLAADEVSVGVGLVRLLVDRKFVVDRVVVRDTRIEVRQLANGEWWVQGGPVEQFLPKRRGDGAGNLGRIEVVGEDIELLFAQPGDEQPRRFQVSTLAARRDDQRLAVDATVELPDELGRGLTVSATQLLTEPAEARHWDVSVEIDDIDLAGVTAMQPAEEAHFESGRGDIELSIAFAGKRIESATAEIDIDDIAIAGLSDLAIAGRLEFYMDDNGWLVAANRLQARTPGGDWPASMIRLEASTNDDGDIVMIDARASYINFAHAVVLEPWLNEQQRGLMQAFDPSGVIRDLTLTLTGLDTESPDYDVSASFEDLGIAAREEQPGARGVTGSIRADTAGGRLEIDSDRLVVTAAKLLGKPLALEEATGTVIWRRSNGRTTLLSDSIVLRNEFLTSETSVELSIADSGGRPVVDLESNLVIDDIGLAGAYVPFMAKRPRMSRWFQEGLISGRVPQASIRLYGPMEKWPFENDEGKLLIRGTLKDAVIVYQPKWPQAQVSEAEIVIENNSLLSERSRITTAGNEVINGRLEIANFRQPIMTIDALATGTLESLRQLSIQSPIGELLGGNLDRVTVEGEATSSLNLRIPIRDWRSFAFTTQIRTADGSLRLAGFNPPLTDISGVITVRRDSVNSEGLGGRFLGQPVAIELQPAPESMPSFRVIANARGGATVEALEREFGLPVGGRASGMAAFDAQLLFPRGNAEEPLPFTVNLQTDLAGVTIDLPQPLRIEAEESLDISASIMLPKGGQRIDSTGNAGELFSWQFAFNKPDNWDFDRGVVMFGTEPIGEPANTRGLHLRGSTDYVYAQDWFDLAKDSDNKLGMGERIRSIDMTVHDLHLIGQHLVDHRVRVDRSANEWLVQLDGENILGSVYVPYDFNSNQAIVVEAERLLFPGDDVETERPRTRVDPRSLPPISIKAGDLAFGNRHLGAVEAEFRRTADGLVTDSVIARDETFEIVGTGGWVVDETDPAGHRSSVTATLTSSNVEATMQRLDYDPGIRSDELSMLLDLSWSGGPNEDLMETLDGEVTVRIGEGQLAEVKPGAGRVFGLMSVAALPRRLALDFRDVFGKGFAFDSISGDFRLDDGDTYTCNLSLESTAADIGIVGRANLVSREYEQTAVISANFGNALPVAGALVAGPQVAAALLIFSRIFKKPLQEVSQVYYGIGGTFDEPLIETITAEQFAASGLMAGCIDEAN